MHTKSLPLGMLFFKVRALTLRPAYGDARCSIARLILCNIFSAYGKDFACVSLFQAFRLPPRSRKISRLASTMDSGFYAIIFSVATHPPPSRPCLHIRGVKRPPPSMLHFCRRNHARFRMRPASNIRFASASPTQSGFGSQRDFQNLASGFEFKHGPKSPA